MTKLCPRGKAAAKRKFKVYPSAYANAYASKICAGKIKDPSGVKRKDFKGPKPAKKGTLATTKNSKRELTEFEKKRKKSQEAYSRAPRKNQQRNPSYTVGKGLETEITFTEINPFTDSVEFKRPYGPASGKSYPIQETSAQRASDKRFKSFKDTVREVDKFKTSKKVKYPVKKRKFGGTSMNGGINYKSIAGMDSFKNYGSQVGGHNVMGSPVSVDVDGDTLSNPSASAYYKDLLK
tara:strand:+ start:1718 stop:2425 length:708 start_codon:yes stop_codon:yes gene_type:complete